MLTTLDHRYRVCGLTITSDVPLPGALAEPLEARPTDIRVRHAAVPAALEQVRDSGPDWWFADGRFLLQVPGVVRFLVSDGREILVEPAAGADPGDAVPFILASTLTIALFQRRCILLHASAVRVDGKAILFCGPSGAGKSTLAAALDQAGYPILADDVCRLDLDGRGVLQIVPDARTSRLWPDSVEQLALQHSAIGQVRPSIAKQFVTPRGAAETDPLPLGALYFLGEPPTSGDVEIKRPPLANAMLELEHNVFLAQIMRRMDLLSRFLACAAAAAPNVFQLVRPMRREATPAIIRALEAHWRDTLGN